MKRRIDRKKLLAGAALGVYLLLTALVFIYVGRPMLRFASQPEKFRAWVDQSGVWSQIGYAGMVLLQVLVALIPGEPLEIAGGYAFGALQGTLLCMLGATLGSVLVFALVRRFGMPMVEVFFTRESTRVLRFLKKSPRRRYLLIALFIIPGTPKDLLCYYAGLTDIRWKHWLLLCSLGRLPSIVTSTMGGDFLGASEFWHALLLFGATLLLSLAGIAIYRAIVRRQRPE